MRVRGKYVFASVDVLESDSSDILEGGRERLLVAIVVDFNDRESASIRGGFSARAVKRPSYGKQPRASHVFPSMHPQY